MHAPKATYKDLTRPTSTGRKTNDLDPLSYTAAQTSFSLFRRLIRRDMEWGWWVEEVANHLQRFYEEFAAGKRPKLALMAPPQHGKSWSVTDFIAWVAGKSPDKKTIFGSYADDLGVRTNLDLQRIILSDTYRRIFKDTQIAEPGWQCNTSLIEYVGHAGSFRNTTVNGPINGQELHLGVIDDPLKGRKEAYSPNVREATWNWFTSDFMSRFAKDGALLIVMTRWHVDDLLGRYLEKEKDVRILRYKAIAEHDEPHRRKGWALFPRHKPLDFLRERRSLLTESAWEAIYQQEPIVIGGGVLPIEKLKVVPMFDRSQIKHTIRYWDKAGTENEKAAYTAGARMHAMKDGTYVISHMVRGQWGALDRETKIKTWADADRAEFGSYEIYVEQEPGSGGKESAENTIRNLAGHRVFADKVTGSKEIRAEPFAAQVQGGNVYLVAGDWVTDFLDECEVWPGGKRKDQVDAAAGAFTKLAVGTAYDTSYSWL